MKKWYENFRTSIKKWAIRWGSAAIFICAFADACCLPLPTPMFFITLIILNITKAYRYALFGTIGSLLGAIIGYSIGHFAWLTSNGEFSTLAQFIFNHVPGFTESLYNSIHNQFIKWDFWILFVASLTPVPYKIFSISSGVFDINLPLFCVATLISQAIKFYVIAWLTTRIGHRIGIILEDKLRPIAIIATVCIAIVIFVIKIY